jgi:hypothetical protein
MSDEYEFPSKYENPLVQPKPPRITRTRWQLVRWHLRCAWMHLLGRL